MLKVPIFLLSNPTYKKYRNIQLFKLALSREEGKGILFAWEKNSESSKKEALPRYRSIPAVCN